MNFIKKSLIILILLISLIYTVNITNIPENIILFENEELNLNQILGVVLKEGREEIVQASNTNSKIENKKITVSLFNLFNVKTVNVSTVQNTKVIPLGNIIGIKLYSDGVLVIGMTEIEGKKPYENTGIREGDLITKVDNVQVTTTQALIECVNKSKGQNVKIQYIREGTEYIANIEPVKTKENKYKIGLWVRDGAMGIGTATYYEPESGKIEGIPGEIRGVINDSQKIGNINLNTEFGIYGKLEETNRLGIDTTNVLDVALKNEIKTGKATILLMLEDGIRKEYEIEIKKIYKNNTEDNKSMLIEITDSELIEKTGGIIQGMSGAPILQNGKFLGAITHVLVNNPIQGYAVFGETMIKQKF